jgi:acyl-CoA thioesterase FadM
MSGLTRNILSFFIGLFSSGSARHDTQTLRHFLITPFDCGIRTLKSDQYFALAESAQVDFLLKTGLFFELIKGQIHFVNLAQLAQFSKPAPVFSLLQVRTQVVACDDKCAYFSHIYNLGDVEIAQVFVKMKFKRSGLTIPATQFFPQCPRTLPSQLMAWNSALK